MDVLKWIVGLLGAGVFAFVAKLWGDRKHGEGYSRGRGDQADQAKQVTMVVDQIAADEYAAAVETAEERARSAIEDPTAEEIAELLKVLD